jgi:putative transposase
VRQLYPVIEQLTQGFSLTLVCRLLKVSKSAYYGARKKTPSHKDEPSSLLVEEVFWQHSRRYGSRRIREELQAQGICLGRRRIRRLMREQGLKAIQPKAFVPRTTDSRHGGRMSPNLLLERDIKVSKPNEVLVGDITYLPLLTGGWVYLATWEDLYSRLVVGWQIEENLEDKLVIGAMKKAILRRSPVTGLIVHSDRGGQYVSKELRELLKSHGIEQSMSRAGETYDNAVAESFFSRYKAELLEGGAFTDIEEARTETITYIEGYYNRVRRHSGLGYKSPEEFERKYYEKLAETLTTNQQKG